MIDYDDDNLYETYVPQVGEMYAEGVYKSRDGGPWRNSTIMRVENPANGYYIYRRPKPIKKEVPMSIPEGWDGSLWCRRWSTAACLGVDYTHWAPQPLAPEAE